MIMVKLQGALEGVVLKQYCSSGSGNGSGSGCGCGSGCGGGGVGVGGGSSSIPTSTNQINPLRTKYLVKNKK
jgi:hypothetical protein